MRDEIARFPKGTAPGPSGLRASHLQYAVRRPGLVAPLVQALATLTRAWVNGTLPLEHAPFFTGANLTPLRKKDNGVRPVAVGEVLRRLVGKALLATPEAKAQLAKLQPVQAGVGVRNATESVAMCTQNLANALGTGQSWVMLQVDLRNAFNCVERLHVMKAAEHYAPSLHNFLRFASADAARLFLRLEGVAVQDGSAPGVSSWPSCLCLGHP